MERYRLFHTLESSNATWGQHFHDVDTCEIYGVNRKSAYIHIPRTNILPTVNSLSSIPPGETISHSTFRQRFSLLPDRDKEPYFLGLTGMRVTWSNHVTHENYVMRVENVRLDFGNEQGQSLARLELRESLAGLISRQIKMNVWSAVVGGVVSLLISGLLSMIFYYTILE